MFDALLLAEALPNDAPEMQASSLAVSALLAGSCLVWFWILARWRRGEPAIEVEPRRPIPWRAPEVVCVIGFLMASTLGAAIFSPQDDKPPVLDELGRTLLVGAGLNLFLAAFVGAFLAIARRADGRDLGLWPKLPDDLFVGGVGWLAALAPVYALQIALVSLVADDRQTHPLIEMLVESRRVDVLIFAAFAAAIVAPIVEEFFFRVLLQGWLEKQFTKSRGDEPALVATADTPAPESSSGEALSPLAPFSPAAAVGDEPLNPFRSPESDLTAFGESVSLPTPDFCGWRGVLPIGISSFLFAAAHAGTWPDPAPLFVLALVLGYVYRQTHRLWPCVVLHMLFNGLSLAIVWFGGQ